MKKRMIKLMTIFCMAGILTVNPAIIGLAEEAEAVGADVSEGTEEVEEKSVEEETEPEEEPAAEEDVEEVSEEESETETVESDVVLEEEAGEVSEAVMSVNEAAMPVMMAAENEEEGAAEEKYVLKYVYNDGTTASSSDQDNTPFNKSYPLKSKPESNKGLHDREGYDFIGWEKGGIIYSPGATYEVTDEDRNSRNITFTAVWRQQVSLSVDGEKVVPLTVEGNATEKQKQVTYNLSEVQNSLTAPENYVFANKWVINDNKTPCDATNNTMTVKFEDKNNTQVYNAVSVNVDGNTDVPIENNTINLYSCWKPTKGSDFRITNGTGYDNFQIKAKDTTNNGTSYISALSDTDKVEFSANGWTLVKTVADLKKAAKTPIYAKKSEKDVNYYQCYALTVTDQDFVKTVNVIYKDQFADTVFYNAGTSVGNSCSKSAEIHPGVIGQTWANILRDNITAKRGDFKFAGWKYFLNGKYEIEDTKKTEINFYNDTSLTVQPVWEGQYTCKDTGYPQSESGVPEPVTGSAVVGDSISLPERNDIKGRANNLRYTFAGWLGSDGKTYASNEKYTIEKANMSFESQWKAVPYDLKFVDKDGTVYSEGKADYNSKITWPSKPTKEGYTFQNWLVEIYNEEIPVEHGEEFQMFDQNTTFTAQWSINSYKISYDGNGAAMGVPAETVEQNYQTDYTIDTVVPTKTGYTFQGWSDGTTTYQPGAVFKVPARDVVLTAQWKANSHQVKYDGNGGKTSAPESKSADYNSNVSVAAGLEKDGYLFDGWEQISTGKVLTPGASFVMPDMDETLKAKWKIAYTGIYEAGVYYLIQGQSYILGPGRKAQGDSSTYTANVTIYVPQSGYYTFE